MKKKECPSCAMEVDAESKVCPICSYEFPEADTPIGRWLMILVVILFLLLYLYLLLR